MCPDFFAQSADPNDQKPPQEMADYDWHKDAHAAGLTDEQLTILLKQGFVVTGTTCKQSFSPYIQ
jgi:hypothetical protein